MQIDIPSHIEKLLFLHDALVIPSFGGFTATRVPAVADYAGGSVSPSSKTLVFSDNLTIDDGILVEDIAQTHGISNEESREAVTGFVEKMQALLTQREIVALPGVGRLYKNYMQKIQFLPEATNFNTESYGLPPLQFSPIARSREVAEKTPETSLDTRQAAPPTAPPVSYTPPPPTYVPYPPPSVSRTSTPLIIMVVLILLGVLAGGIWWWRKQHAATEHPVADKTEEVIEDITVPADPVTKTQKTAVKPADKPAQTQKEQDASVEKSVAKKMQEAREEIQQGNKTGRECILIIATLKEKTNADRLTQMLKNGGYTVYSVQNKGYQVGIQFRYTNLSEVQQKLEALEKLTGEKDIWIKKK